MRRGAPWTVERHQVAAWSLPWLRSRWQCCHRRSQPWFAKPQTPAPQQGARRVPAGRLRGRGDPGCSSAFRAVVCRLLSASLLVRHGVPGGGDGVRKAVRSWRPLWTPDTTAWTLDGDRACGRFGIEQGQVVTMGGSRCWEQLRLAEGSRRIVVLSGHGQDERAAWLAVAGWPGAWSDAGRWRCPLLGRRRPDRVRYPSAGRSP